MSVNEEIILKVSGDVSNALDALSRIEKAVGGLGKGIEDTKRQVSALDKIGGAFNSITAAIGGLAAASGLGRLVSQLKDLTAQAIESAAAMQSLRIGIETLAAKELVKAGQFETVSDALGAASGKAEELMNWLRDLSVTSPFEYTQVAATFRMMMAFGATSETAQSLTSAILDTGAGLGLMGQQLDRLSYNFGQIIATGKITARDLRDLNMVGLDLAEVFHSSLGKSVEEVNAALKSGAMTAKDVSQAFADYAQKNFGGAAARMATSFEGLKSSIKDVFFFTGADLLGPLLEKVTGILSKLLDSATALMRSGVLKKVGEFLATPIGMTLVAAIGAVVAGITTLGGAMAGIAVLAPMIVSAFTAILAALGTIAGALAPLAPLILPIIAIAALLAAGLTALVAVGAVMVKAFKEDWGGIRSTVERTIKIITPYLTFLQAKFAAWSQVIGTKLKVIGAQLQSLVKDWLEPLFARIAQIIANINWDSLFGTLSDTLNVILGTISAWLDVLSRLLHGEGLQAFSSLEDAAIDGLTLVALVFDKYIKGALVWGWNLIVQVANGISNAAQSVLVGVMRSIGNLIGNFLAPGSPPKEGPLSNIIKWGQGLINTFLRSFKLADFGLMRDALTPIQGVLESALQAGDIDEADFTKIFGTVREQVAAVIAEFRKTGQISEEALAKIAESLGEGGEEYVKFLRLQLQHQQALDRLRAVQEEVAAAEAAGFIPAALKEKLAAAQEEADAAQEAVEWQREYLEMQQDSIDLQLRLVQALEKLNEALGSVGAGVGAAGGGGGGLADALGADELAGAAGGIAAGLDTVKAALGGMTPEFEAMRAKVVAWLESFKAWLALPLGDKVRLLAQYLSDVTGIDFTGFLDTVIKTIEKIDEEGLLAVIQQWIAKGLAFLVINFPIWSEQVKVILLNMFALAVAKLLELIEEGKVLLANWFASIVVKFITWIGEQAPVWGVSLKTMFAMTWARFLALLLSLIPQHIKDLVSWIQSVVAGFVTDVLSKIDEWADGLRQIGSAIVGKIRTGISETWDMISYLGGLLGGVAQSILDGDFITGLASVGAAIVAQIKKGISDAWDAFIAWVQGKLGEIADNLPFSEPKDVRSPLRNLGRSGQALVRNFASGIDFAPITRALNVELVRTQRALSGTGTVALSQQFGDIIFPNVRDGRDAVGVRRGLQRQALEASMVGRAFAGA